MCGFVGCFGKVDDKVISAGNSILHRGPDEQKYIKGNDWSIQFNRLSIIDLSNSAMQPFSFNEVDVYVNGEIYNYIELKKKYENEFTFKTSSDVEIIPFLYLKYGIDFLNQINGMFSMVIIDVDLYEPTIKILNSLKNNIQKNGLIVFDEGNSKLMPGEGIALKEFLNENKRRFKLEKISFSRQPDIILKKIT